MKTLKNLKLILPLLFLAFLMSCNDSESSDINSAAPTITVRLVDEPGDFEAVNIEVVDVMIKMDDDSDDDDGWISLEANSKTLNLLDLTGGVNEVLVDRFPIPVGTLKQMRLVLGDGNTIVIKNEDNEDEVHELKTPSGQQSGLKLKVDAVIEEGFTYDYIIDFDVEKSIVIAGNSDNIILKPVLYVSTVVTSGIIEGMVSPSEIPAVVSVFVDNGNDDPSDDFTITANTDENGAFALWGVPGGTYDVVATPVDSESDYTDGSALGVAVTNGEITTIADPIELQLKPGSISGDVTNDIVVTVTVKDGDDNEVAMQDSNADGEFLIEDIPVGTYTVTLSAEGYVSQVYTKDSSTDVVVIAQTETVLDAVTLVAE